MLTNERPGYFLIIELIFLNIKSHTADWGCYVDLYSPWDMRGLMEATVFS